MIKLERAKKIISSRGKPIQRWECVPLLESNNRILAQNLKAPLNQPPFTNSAMDGYAFKASETKKASLENPVKLKIEAFLSAGSGFARLRPGYAVEIATGAPLPKGADAVIPREHAQIEKNNIVISACIQKGENVRYCGENVKRGETLFFRGTLIQPKHLGLMASFGFDQVKVFSGPAVAYFSTGNELVDFHQPKRNHQIYNSNAASLEALFKEQGCGFLNFGICRDDLKTTLTYVKKALSFSPDLLVITGGVSAGRHDYVKEALVEIGAKIVFHKVAVKPGKPILFAEFKSTFIFGLPGNPFATQVGFYQFVLPLIQKMKHQRNVMNGVNARLLQPLKQQQRHQFIVGLQKEKKGFLYVSPILSDSGDVSAFAKGTCFISVPAGTRTLKKGSLVNIQPY